MLRNVKNRRNSCKFNIQQPFVGQMLKTHNIEPLEHLNLMVYQHFKDNLKFLHKKPPYVTLNIESLKSQSQTAILHKNPPYGHHFQEYLTKTPFHVTNPAGL
jgi:hypothetical protein